MSLIMIPPPNILEFIKKNTKKYQKTEIYNKTI